MLGKLLKYEFKSTARSLIPCYGALLLMAILTRIFAVGGNGSMENNSFIMQTAGVISVVLFVALMIAVFVLTFVVIIQRFYKDLFGEQGYLANTLPVKPWMHITSKTIAAIVWSIISGLVAILACCILLLFNGYFTEFFRMLPDAIRAIVQYINLDVALFAVESIVLIVLGTILSLWLLYAAISLGQTAHKNRVLCSFAWFLGLNTALEIIISTIGRFTPQIIMEPQGITGIHGTFWYIIAIELIFSAGLFFITNYMMTKKLNLE